MPRRPKRRAGGAPAPDPEPFTTRRQAAFYVAGLTAFFGGFFVVVALFAAYGARTLDRGPLSIAAVAFFIVALAGHFTWISALRFVQENLTGVRPRAYPMGYPSLRVLSRSLGMSMMGAAARVLGVPGSALTAWLYGLLFASAFGFFFAIARTR